ncbi:MAG: DUF4055 domain-containing protein [bacterium]|nr:DUF4055 domain-containing protein [bacterium]
MPVDSQHPEYTSNLPDWTLCDDLFQGEAQIKSKGTVYLPRLTKQNSFQYTSYKDRGEFFNAFGRTVSGLTGSVFRKNPTYTIPKKMEYQLSSMSDTGQTMETLANEATQLIIKYGRCGLLIDKGIDKDSNAFIYVCGPEKIINWRSEFIGGMEVLSLIVLKETLLEPDPKDEYKPVEVQQIRIFKLVDNKCKVEVWKKYEDEGKYTQQTDDDLYLSIYEKPLDYIPFVFLGSENNDSAVDKPPLIDLAYINISHWKKSVDMAHGLHFAALPTPVLAGFDPKGSYSIGPQQFLVSKNESASASFLEFTGKGLEAVEKALERNERMMAVLGARLIEKTRDKVETAETARIRQAGETSALSQIVKGVSQGLTEALKYVAIWQNEPSEDIVYTLNTDFVAMQISPQQITALMAALQGKGISQDTFIHQMIEGEIVPEGITIEEERELIEANSMNEFDENNDSNMGEGSDESET